MINEISTITQEERKCADILGDVMAMLFRLANSKATDDAKAIFASKGANQVYCISVKTIMKSEFGNNIIFL